MATIKNDVQDRMPGWVLIALHLAPGVIFAACFYVLSWIFIRAGLTGYLALLVTIPVCLAPLELGVMLFWSARTTGKRSLSGAISYRRPGSAVDYIVLPVILFVSYAVLSIAAGPVSRYLDAHLSHLLPGWTAQAALVDGMIGVSRVQRAVTIGLAVILSGFVSPAVEEMYFRGFLLPRMARWGWAAPISNALLFAVYHFYFPGNVPGIFLAFIPISCVAMVKKNWRIGMVVHSMFNLWGVYTLVRLTG